MSADQTITCSLCGHPLATRHETGDLCQKGWRDTLRLTPGVSADGMQVHDGRLHVRCPICATWADVTDAPDASRSSPDD